MKGGLIHKVVCNKYNFFLLLTQTMEEVKHTTSFPPHSTIYVSSSSSSSSSSAPPKSSLQSFEIDSDVSEYHFHLIWLPGDHYTTDPNEKNKININQCQGKCECMCGRQIQGRIYFIPLESKPPNGMVCSPVPHCRPGCVLRSIEEGGRNKSFLLTQFYLTYGKDIIMAPPRFMLKTPGGLSLDEYHAKMDQGVILQDHPWQTLPFFAEIYVSSTLFQNHQLVPDVVNFIDQRTEDKKTAMAQARKRDDRTLNIVSLPPKRLDQSRISELFAMDPGSLQRAVNAPFLSTETQPMEEEE